MNRYDLGAMVDVNPEPDASSDSAGAEREQNVARTSPTPDTSQRTVHKDAPDPVIGIGLVILGVLVMGVAGAATLHYVFNIGTAIAIVGAIVFLVCVAMSSLSERKLRSS